MLATARLLSRILTIASLLGLFGDGAFAQVRQVQRGQNAPPIDDDEDMEEEAVVQPVQNFMISDDNFDMWLFGGGRNSQAARTRLESILSLEVDRLDKNCSMTDTQKKKLMLAGRGDIKRFFDKVAEKKRKFDQLKNDQNRVGEIFQEIQPLQMTFNAGIFNDGSFFAKTVKNTLNEEQTTRYAKVIRERDLFRYRARVDLVVSMLDNSVGFSAEQRKKFVLLLMEETKPPKHFGQYDTQVILLQASKLPESKIKPIFDDAQWRILSRQLTQAKSMELFLKRNGFLDDDGAADNKPKVNTIPAIRLQPAQERRQ